VANAINTTAARESLRKVALQGADVVGRATSGSRVLPELLICGGQRCGTTSMYKALVQQPTIFRPVWRKGVHYFDIGYDHGLDWYRAHFPLEAQLNRAAKKHGTRALSFESSPYYLFHPLAADRIAASLPNVSVIVLVRDPVERAYSAHAHEYARGFETLDFEAALAAENDRTAGEAERLRADPTYRSHAHRHQAYRSRGEYAPQLERLAGLFGRDRVKVVDSQRFFTTPESEFGDVMEWLDVAPRVDTSFERHNARPRTEMPASLRKELEEHFEPHDRALELWLGRTPSWRE
jgi:hypothetical protein